MTPTPQPIARPILIIAVCAALHPCIAAAQGVDQQLSERSLTVIREAMRKQERWVKVHAAEALLALGHDRKEVAAIFQRELKLAGDVPEYRVGIRRVLARAAVEPADRQRWIGEIREMFLDQAAPDRLHAAETLGKLGYGVAPEGDEEFERVASAEENVLGAYATWVVANSTPEKGQTRLAKLLTAEDAHVRGVAAYALRMLPTLQPGILERLKTALKAEPEDSPVRNGLTCGIYVHAEAEARADTESAILNYVSSGVKGDIYQACFALAERAKTNVLPKLTPLLEHDDADIRLASAMAILQIKQREADRD